MTSPWQRTWSPAHEETFPLVHCWQQPLWRTYVCERVTKPWKLKPDVLIISASTEMSDELLSDLHPLQQLLQETISEPLLDGGDVGLHVFEAPENEVTRSYDHCGFFTFNNWMISDSICCRNVISLQITNLTPGNHQPSSFKNEGSTSGVPSVPCHSVSIQLQELEQLVRLLSISGLFFCRECVVGHQQRVCPTSCTNTGRPPELTDTAIKTNQKNNPAVGHRRAFPPLACSSSFFFRPQVLW